MSLLHLYSRVLTLLGPQKKLGVFLAIANFALAGAMFAEPVLFGRIIDALAGAQAKGTTASWPDLIKLIAASGCSPSSSASSSRSMPTASPTSGGKRC
jgi:hypothetical protein